MHFRLCAVFEKDGAVALQLHERGDRPARRTDGEPLEIFADLIKEHDDRAFHVLAGGERPHGGDEHQQIFVEEHAKMQPAAEGARHVLDDGENDRPARCGKRGEIQPEGDPFAARMREIEHERGQEKEQPDGDGYKLCKMQIALLRRVAVHDLHLLEMRDGIDGFLQGLLPLVTERDALSHKIDGNFAHALDGGELFLQLSSARRAVEPAYLDDLFHGVPLRNYS